MKLFLDKNDISILREFLHKDSIPLDELVKLLNLKERSIKYKIDNINLVFHESGYNMNLIFKDIDLILMDKEKKLLQFLENFEIKNYNFSKKERIEILEFAYLAALDGYRAEELENTLNIERGTLKNDLHELKKCFSRENINFSSVPKLGLAVKGRENTIRKLLIERILKYFYIKDFDKLVLKDEMSMESRAVEHFAGNIFSYEILNIYNLLKLIENKMKKEISEEGYQILIIYLLVSIFRTEKFPLTEYDISSESLLIGSKEYKIVNQVFKKEKDIKFNKYEILKLLEYLAGAYSYNLEHSFYENWIKIETLARELIKNLEEETGVLIGDNKNFEEELIKYLRPAIYRMKNEVSNSSIDYREVMDTYQFLYNATKKSLKSLENFLGKKIDENEIAYLTVYLRMVVDNYKKNNETDIDKNILIVCTYGYGTSQLLKERIKHTYKVNEVKVLSYEEYLNYDLSNTQVIVTNLDLEKSNEKIPIIKVTPLINENDMKKLDFYMERKVPVKIEVEKILEIINKYTLVESSPEMMNELADYCNDTEYKAKNGLLELFPEE
jgi:mannitol operon transcriptional antiterminator